MNPIGYINEDVFEQEWGAQAKPDGALWDWREIQKFPVNRVWTVYEDSIIDDHGNEDRTWYAMPGIVPSWAIGYLVSGKEWKADTPHAIWYLDDAGEEEREERRRFNLAGLRRHSSADPREEAGR